MYQVRFVGFPIRNSVETRSIANLLFMTFLISSFLSACGLILRKHGKLRLCQCCTSLMRVNIGEVIIYFRVTGMVMITNTKLLQTRVTNSYNWLVLIKDYNATHGLSFHNLVVISWQVRFHIQHTKPNSLESKHKAFPKSNSHHSRKLIDKYIFTTGTLQFCPGLSVVCLCIWGIIPIQFYVHLFLFHSVQESHAKVKLAYQPQMFFDELNFQIYI